MEILSRVCSFAEGRGLETPAWAGGGPSKEAARTMEEEGRRGKLEVRTMHEKLGHIWREDGA